MKFFKLAILFMFIINFDTALAEETIRIATGNWPPYLSRDLKHNGIAAHIISDIFASEGFKVEFDFVPWARAYELSKKGDYDGTAVWLKKPERETDFYFSDPVVKEKHVFFHLKSFKFEWNSIDDLQGLKIGGIAKFSYGEAFDKAEKSGKLQVDRTTNDISNFKKLLGQRLQIYPQEINVGHYVLQTNFKPEDIQRITSNPKLLMSNFSYLLLSKKIERNKALIVKFNNELQRLKSSGKYDRYFEAFQKGEYKKQ